MKLKPHAGFESVFWIGKQLATINLTPGHQVYGENLIKIKGVEYRIWDHCRSKPAAAIFKGIKEMPIKRGDKVLYLGAAQGTTASHFSDIIGKQGLIYAVEISPRAIRDILFVAERRKNIFPILSNAREPERYRWVEKVDLVYQDVATRDQSDILIRNTNMFLKDNGFAVIAIKARSIDVVEKPERIYREETKKLSKHFKIVEKAELDPYERDHLFLVMKIKG